MRIATLQFAPKLGATAANFSRAESLLMREEREGVLAGLDLLVLPELAFAGYNHPSLAAIAPYLEPTAAGPSTRWAARTAKRLKCTVAVGYAEAAGAGRDGDGGQEGGDAGDEEDGHGNYNTVFDGKIGAGKDLRAFNSLVFVDARGEVVAHYRKRFLYYTDENWAQEGDRMFYAGVLPIGGGGRQVKLAAGICMDINPYKFEAPWTAFEFANHAREARARVVVVCMAWLTRLSREETIGDVMRPDMDTVGYWVERFGPLLGPMAGEGEVLIVFANRAGEEGVDAKIGEVRYAGSSCVMGMTRGRRV